MSSSKILFIGSTRFDYGQDLAYSGLVELLGAERVRDYPFNFSYHLRTRIYPKNLSKTDSGLFSSLVAQANVDAKNADLVIVGSAKPDTFQSYLKILDLVPSSTPIVLLDGGDREEIGGDLFRANAEDLWNSAISRRPFDFIFKREFLKHNTYAKNVHPFPFSMNLKALGVKPSLTKDKQVAFWAMNSHPIREKAFQILKGQFDCDSNGTGPSVSMKTYARKGKQYHSDLSKSKIVLSLRGGGWDTLRYWEVPALGSLLVSTPLEIQIPDDFQDRKHIVHCKSDLSDLLEICNYYLEHETERQRIAEAGHRHLLAHHTNIHRARTLLEKVGIPYL